MFNFKEGNELVPTVDCVSGELVGREQVLPFSKWGTQCPLAAEFCNCSPTDPGLRALPSAFTIPNASGPQNNPATCSSWNITRLREGAIGSRLL